MSFDWEQFAVNPEQSSPNQAPFLKSDDFEQYAVQEEPTFKEEVRRHTARTGSRIGETILGLPGDILNLPKKLLTKPISGITGLPEEKISKSFAKTAPTSQELKKLSSDIFGKTVEPQSQTESLIDDIVSDAAALAIPVKGKIPFLRSIGTAIAGNIAQKGVEQLGIGETGQSAAKIGTFFLAGLSGRGGLKKFWNQKYKEADAAIPKGATLDASKLGSDLTNLESELKKGLETSSQKAILKPLEELRSKIKNGTLSVEDAVASKRSLNELRESLFEEIKGKTARRGAKTKLNDISRFLDKSLENYGKENPAFYKPYKAANEAYGGFQQSKKVGRWISKMIPHAKTSGATVAILEKVFFPSAILPTLTGAGAGLAALKTGEIAARLFKNPTLKRYYADLIRNSIKENSAGTIKSIKGIDKEISKNPDEWEEFLSQSE